MERDCNTITVLLLLLFQINNQSINQSINQSTRQTNLETACWGVRPITGHYGCLMNDMAEDNTRQTNLETACWGVRPITGHYGCLMNDMAEDNTRQTNLETAWWGVRPTTGHYGCLMNDEMNTTNENYAFKKLLLNAATFSRKPAHKIIPSWHWKQLDVQICYTSLSVEIPHWWPCCQSVRRN